MPDTGKCRGCGKDVLWAKTVDGRTIPLDVRRELRFVFVMNEDRVVLTPTYQTHFATCPVSDQFRRKELKLDKN